MRDYNEPISDAGHVVGDGLLKRIKDLEAEVERMADAAAFDRAIFSGERRIRQAAITRALAAEAEVERLRAALERIANSNGPRTAEYRSIARAALEARP